jgi:hypothetical protein
VPWIGGRKGTGEFLKAFDLAGEHFTIAKCPTLFGQVELQLGGSSLHGWGSFLLLLVPPKTIESIRIKVGVDYCAMDVFVSQIILQ